MMTAGGLKRMPPWRVLAGLAFTVLALHLLALTLAPLKLGIHSDPKPLSTRAFITRSIVPAPPLVQAAAEAPAAVKAPKQVPRPQPVRVKPKKPALTPQPIQADAIAVPAPAPEFFQNEAIAQVNTALVATENIANAETRPVTDEPAPPGAAITSPTAPAPVMPAAPVVSPASAAPQALPLSVITSVKLADSVLLGYKMTGSAKGLTYHAHGDLSWRNLGDAYEASLKVSAFILGSRSMSSRGKITPAGLAPERFSDKSRSEQAAHFDAAAGKITFSANTPDAPLLAGAQDRVSVFFQLAGILAAGPGNQTGAIALPLGTSITIYTVGPREADTWTFVVESEDLLMLPAGEMVALKLTRVPRRPYDQKVEIWYAPSMAFLPVRSRVTQANGDFIDQQLESAEKL